MNLLLCDRDMHCTLYTPQSNVFCVDPSNGMYKYDVTCNSLLYSLIRFYMWNVSMDE